MEKVNLKDTSERSKCFDHHVIVEGVFLQDSDSCTSHESCPGPCPKRESFVFDVNTTTHGRVEERSGVSGSKDRYGEGDRKSP